MVSFHCLCIVRYERKSVDDEWSSSLSSETHTCWYRYGEQFTHVFPLSDIVLFYNELLNFNPKHIPSCLTLSIQQLWSCYFPGPSLRFSMDVFPSTTTTTTPAPAQGSSQQNRWSSLLPGLVVSVLLISSTSPKHARGLTVHVWSYTQTDEIVQT